MADQGTSTLAQALWFGRRAVQDGFLPPDALLDAIFSYMETQPNHSVKEHLVQQGLLTAFQGDSLNKRLDPLPDSWQLPTSQGSTPSTLTTDTSRYELGDIIQQGGVGRIYRAYDHRIGRHVAIKCLLDPGNTAAQERFAREYRITGSLEHPNIISVHDAGLSDELGPFYVMRLLEGQTLQDVLQRAHDQGTPGRTALLRTFLELCAAMAYAHGRGIVHRDLKPANIMVGDLGEAQVMDWGIALQVIENNLPTVLPYTSKEPHHSQVMGTPGYMAPEQARGENPVDERADIFALGCILYQTLTGQLPFRGYHLEDYIKALEGEPVPPSQHNPSVSKEMDAITLRMLANKPQDRYATVREVSTALTLYLEGTKTRKLREQRALAKVVEGIQARNNLEQREAKAEELLGELRGEQARLRPYDNLEKKRPLWDKERKIEALEEEAMDWLGEATSVLTQALALNPESQEAHNQLAELYHGRLLVAERRRDVGQQAYQEAMLRRHNNGRYDEFLKGEGVVWLLSDPPGARVTLYRMEEQDRILSPVEPQELGESPIGPLVLPKGSYLAILTMAGFQETRLPVLVQRDQRNIYRARMYQDNDCPEGFVYIPQGRFLMGGDPLTASAGRTERPFVQDMWMATFPVTVNDYLEFLNAHPEKLKAEPHVPRRSPDGGFYLPLTNEQWVLPEMDEDGDVWDPQWPVFSVSWYDAQAYADWRASVSHNSLRLPLSMELEKAARGVDGRFYPWGDHFDATFCKMGKSRPGPPKPESVGEYTKDISIYGVRDLAGGIREWCGDEMDPPDGALAFGGNWSGSELTSRAAHRWFLQKGQVTPGLGLRLAMNADAMPYHEGFREIQEGKPTHVSMHQRQNQRTPSPTDSNLKEQLASPDLWRHLVTHNDEAALAWLAQAARIQGATWSMIQAQGEDTPLAITGEAPDPLPSATLHLLSQRTTQEEAPSSEEQTPSPRMYRVYPCGDEGQEPLGYLVLPPGQPLSPENQDALAYPISLVLSRRQERQQAQRREQQAQQEASQVRQQLTIVREAFATVAPDTYLQEAYPLLDGQSRPMRKLFRMLDRVSQSDVNVLVRGESGVGKERVARTIHQNGPSPDGPFVAVNCGAIPENLVESELFGHVKGAFTGANQDHTGLFRQAHQGTLFLDEIGELSLEAQVKLLRALQNRTVRPVGGSTEYPFKARILAATHRDLKQMAEQGTFREDLYWRLVVVELEIPPLRERPEDIPLLVSRFLSQADPKPEITAEAMDILQRYPWPGNIRELENEIRRVLVVADDTISPKAFSQKLRESLKGSDSPRLQGTLREIVAHVERDAILLALQQAKGNKAETARKLGLSKRGLQLKLKRYNINE